MQNNRTNKWLLPVKSSCEESARLLCFPYAGAGASLFHAWFEDFNDFPVKIHAVQIPGRENRFREPPFTSMRALIESLTVALEPLLDRDYCLFGHSLGGLIGFELAREFRRRRLPMPKQLFISATAPPHSQFNGEAYHLLPDAQFLAALRQNWRGFSDEIVANAALMRVILPSLRADVTLCETYRYVAEAPLDVPFHVFAGEKDPLGHGRLADWKRFTATEFTLETVPGDHFFIHSSRDELITRIKRKLIRIL